MKKNNAKSNKLLGGVKMYSYLKGIVKEIMENTIELSVPLIVDINTGTNLYEAK